jgi:hypothetical protein
MFGVVGIPITSLFSHSAVAGSAFSKRSTASWAAPRSSSASSLSSFLVFASGTVSYAVAHLAMVLVLGNTEVVAWRQPIGCVHHSSGNGAVWFETFLVNPAAMVDLHCLHDTLHCWDCNRKICNAATVHRGGQLNLPFQIASPVGVSLTTSGLIARPRSQGRIARTIATADGLTD